MSFREILLMPNLDKQGSVECLTATVDQLTSLGLTPLLDKRFTSHLEERRYVTGEFDQLLARCDLILPIGGDGTILHCVRYAVEADKPILGINAGRVGFLTQMESTELAQLERLCAEDIRLEERMLLEAVLPGDGRQGCRLALNDVIIRGKQGQLTDLIVHSGQRQIAWLRADGLIFATPTGSTAHSLSAGGCIADPTLSVVLMTAICPHSAYNRSYILPADTAYTVGGRGDYTLQLAFDGDRAAVIHSGETVLIRRSSRTVRFVDLGLRDFYGNLYEKLSLRR